MLGFRNVVSNSEEPYLPQFRVFPIALNVAVMREYLLEQ